MTTEDEILKVAPDPVRVGREAAADQWERTGFAAWAREARLGLADTQPAVYNAILGARAMQEALAAHLAAGAKPVAWAYEFHEFGDVWKRHVILNRPGGGANPPTKHHGDPVRNVAPLYATPPAPAVKVKALEWHTWPADGSASSIAGYPRRYRRLRAMTKIGAYFINEGLEVGDEPHFYVDLSGTHIGDGDTLEAAKATAQADYEQRIRSALVEDAGAAGLGARRELDVDGFGALPVLEPTPAPASDPQELADRLRSNIGQYLRGILSLDDIEKDEEEAAARIRSDAATIASLRAEEADYNDERSRDLSVALARAETAETELDALKAEVARKDAALADIASALPNVNGFSRVDRMARIARAALAPIPAKEG